VPPSNGLQARPTSVTVGICQRVHRTDKNCTGGSKGSTGQVKRRHGSVLQPEEDPCTRVQPRSRVYLNASDIQTTRPSKKLSNRHLGPFTVEQKVGNGAYRLQLPQSMKRLHPVFNAVKLTPAPPDPIVGQRAPPLPPPEIIDREEEWVVEEILDSKMMNWKLRYLVKWENLTQFLGAMGQCARTGTHCGLSLETPWSSETHSVSGI
jgi:hypothetical protein